MHQSIYIGLWTHYHVCKVDITRDPNLRGVCMGLCRAVLVQLGFYFHMKMGMGAPELALSRPLIFAICIMLVFSIVIALFKDMPDVKGDAQVRTGISHTLCHLLN